MSKTLALAAALSLPATTALAQPTRVMVRAQAQDAKFIGDQMGGVEITLSDARTGKVLAKGLTRGGTGDTPRIMRTPRVRGAALTDDKTAGFEATLDLAAPTLVRAEAVGPMGKPDSATRAASSLWVIPGRDVLGDGWVLAFPGIVVEPTATAAPGGPLRLHAKIQLMCGCPIETGGLWDAANYSVAAHLSRRGKAVAQAPLAFTGKTGEYAAAIPQPPPGRYTVRFVAVDAKTLNAGVVERRVRIAK